MTRVHAIAMAGLLLAALPVLGVSPVTISHTSPADFAEAEVKQVVAWNLGELTLGRSTRVVLEGQADVDAVSALAVGPGGEVLVGTAAQGLLLRIAPDDKVTRLADLEGVIVTDLLVDGEAVYAATAGGTAGVYRIEPAADSGTVRRVWADEAAKSVWAIARAGSTLFAATAPQGKVYAIEADGSAQVIFTAAQGALRSIATAGPAVLVGTGEEGLVYRLEKKNGRWVSRVLLDAEEREIVALAVDAQGGVYAAATDATPAGPTAPADSDGGRPADTAPSRPASQPATAAAKEPGAHQTSRQGGTGFQPVTDSEKDAALQGGTGFQPVMESEKDAPPGRAPAALKTDPAEEPDEQADQADDERDDEEESEDDDPSQTGPAKDAPAPPTRPAEGPAAPRPGRARGGRGGEGKGNTVYRIAPDGLVKVVTRQSRTIGDMVLTGEKLFLATSGEKEGAVVEVRLDTGAWGAVATVEPRQVTALVPGGEGSLLAGTADAASVVRLEGRLAETGTLVSTPMDAEQIARWSAVDVQAEQEGGSTVTVATRTGNVAEPSESTWSPWSQEIPAGAGWAALQSPAGRFCQYRLSLTRGRVGERDVSPVVDAVQLVHQVGNLPPEVESVTAEPADRSKAQAAGKETGPLRYRLIKIKADDANKDELRYTVYFRQRGTELWIKADAELDKPSYTWDTQTVPDGVYEVKVQASDEPGNAPATALKHAWVSRPVVVDNSPPVIVELGARPEGRKVLLAVKVRDASRIAALQYVVDSGDTPVVLDAADGVYDTPAEQAAAAIEDLDGGPHVITVRAQDEYGNAVYQAVTVVLAEGQSARSD